jgi:hypothetical protein
MHMIVFAVELPRPGPALTFRMASSQHAGAGHAAPVLRHEDHMNV